MDENENEEDGMDVDEKRDRSVSVLSQQQNQQAQAGPSGRRVTRGPYRRPGQGGASSGISEMLEPDGGLPGSKDGLGAFPPGSDWAKTLLALKLKSTILSHPCFDIILSMFTSLLLEKRYKTKKERLRMERDGPPLLADGSLDYTESEPFLTKIREWFLTCSFLLVEDPFSVLSFFVPEPQTRPHLVPLYPPLGPLPPSTPISTSISTSSDVPHTRAFPSTTALPLDYTPAALPLDYNPQQTQKKAPTSRRRHWTITRNTTSRQKGKEKEDDHIDSLGGGGGGFGVEVPAWQVAREAHALDFGCFALLGAELEAEMRRRSGVGVNGVNGTTGSVLDAGEKGDREEDVLLGLVRSSLDYSQAAKEDGATAAPATVPTPTPAIRTPRTGANLLATAYWTSLRAAEAEDYIRDVVYGGVDGLAYVRSLAEFVGDHRVRVFSEGNEDLIFIYFSQNSDTSTVMKFFFCWL